MTAMTGIPKMGIAVIRHSESIDHRMKELDLEPLSPREIQFRVRAGETPESVAESTGWPLDRVLRYADPPLGERAYVAERAQTTYIHMTRGGATLAEVVATTTGNPDAEWDSFYADGQWIVSASSELESAHWTFEPTGNTVHPLNDIARSWMGLDPVRQVSRQENRADSGSSSHSDTVVIEQRESAGQVQPAEPVRLVAVPTPVEDVENSDTGQPDELFPVETQSRTQASQATSTEPAPKKSKRGRAKVPSWDEILFGGPKNAD